MSDLELEALAAFVKHEAVAMEGLNQYRIMRDEVVGHTEISPAAERLFHELQVRKIVS